MRLFSRLSSWQALAMISASAVACAPSNDDVKERTRARSIAAAADGLSSAMHLAAADAKLSHALRPATTAFAADVGSFTSSAWRAGARAATYEVGARIEANYAKGFEVALGQSKDHRVSFVPEGARDVAPVLDGGRVIFQDAYPSSDAIFVEDDGAIELFVLMRDESAPSEVRFALNLPTGVPSVIESKDGGLRFLDARGRALFHMARPYAIDAAGVRRDAVAHLEGSSVVLQLDRSGLRMPILLDPVLETRAWETRQGPPKWRWGHAATYDAKHDTVVIAGGSSDSLRLSDAYAWDGSRWSLLSNEEFSGRTYGALAYDSSRDRLVLFGGDHYGTDLGDTWEYDGTSWSLRATTGPSARSSHAMVYDAARKKTFLYGGSTGSDETWTWDGAAWALVKPATSPGPRVGAGIAYDEKRARVVMFGGRTPGATSTDLDDTWEWNGADWTKITTSITPSVRSDFAMTYDVSAGSVLMVGGVHRTTAKDYYLGDTWAWDGTTWTKKSDSGFLPRARISLVYDRKHDRTVLVGGFDGSSSLYSMFLWDGSAWSPPPMPTANPPARSDAAMVFDPVHENVVLFGGETDDGEMDDTWLWDGAGWTLSTATGPSARSGHAMAWDDARDEVVLFGGSSSDATGAVTFVGDTWRWNGTSWALVTSTGPTPRDFTAMAYDRVRKLTVLFGGHEQAADGSDVYLRDTWTWDGTTWTERKPTTSPGARSGHAMVYDVKNASVFLAAGEDATAYLDNVWSWDGTNWKGGPLLPVTRTAPGLAYDEVTDTVVFYGGQAGSGSTEYLGDTYELRAGKWVKTTGSGRLTRARHAMTFDGKRRRVLAFGGEDGSGYFADTLEYERRAVACTTTADCVTGTCIDGVCCRQSSCSGVCMACDTAVNPGVCDFVAKGGADPDSCSAAGSVCDGTGNCRKALGQPCTDSAECMTGSCADGVCCGTPCTGQCESCAVVGSVGTCKAIGGKPVGGRAACAGDGTTCGGECDGKLGSSCTYPSGTSCGAPTCKDRSFVAGATCNGAGACAAPPPIACGDFACETSGCRTSCDTVAHCAPGYSCIDHQCVPPGASCSPDRTKAIDRDGVVHACAPYLCAANGTCPSACAITTDCADGNVCDLGSKQCVPAAPPESGGSCSFGGGQGSGTWIVGLLSMLALAARRRNRRHT